MNSLTEENYLKALFNLAGDNGGVNVNDLSRHLDIKMPTVTSMMKKLAAKKLVHYQSYKPIRLTEKGKREAGLIIRKHRLTEMYLVGKMGFGWEAVHEIAEQIEHIQSVAFFDKMDELLGFPKFDPHGAAIPDRNGKVAWVTYHRLSDCEAGQTAILSAVVHSSSEFLRLLNNRGIRLGLRLKIKSIEPFDQSMVVLYDDRQETLSPAVCERLLVDKVK
ncbi:MAG TPA: metal-dependent transcriptional regulator [Puia sp.]|nr:metal-dependent transcriptional regulator [Puia sp.]